MKSWHTWGRRPRRHTASRVRYRPGHRARLEFLEPRELLAVVADTNTKIVHNIYADVLDRIPGAAEVSYWTQRLAQGATNSAIALGFLQSVENRQNVVRQAYFDYLGRAPDPAGLDFWVARFGADPSELDLVSGLHNSQEYYNRQGGTGSDFVRALYREVLHRTLPPAAEEIQYHLNRMAAGVTQGGISLGFLNSPEYLGVRIDTFYRDILDRDADAAGRQDWLNRLLAGAKPFDVQLALLDTAEYRSLANRHAAPGAIVTLLGERLDPQQEISVRFTDTSGAAQVLPAVAAGTNFVKVVAPPVGNGQGGHATGAFQLQVLQNGTVNGSTTMGALTIDTLLDDGLADGVVTQAFISGLLRAYDDAEARLAGTSYDTTTVHDAFQQQRDKLTSWQTAVDQVLASPSVSTDLGTANGQTFILNHSSLARTDKHLAQFLRVYAPDILADLQASATATSLSVPETGSRGAAPEASASLSATVLASSALTDLELSKLLAGEETANHQAEAQRLQLTGYGLYGFSLGVSLGGLGAIILGGPVAPAAALLLGAGSILTGYGAVGLIETTESDVVALRSAYDDLARYGKSKLDAWQAAANGALDQSLDVTRYLFDVFQSAGPAGRINVSQTQFTTHESLREEVVFTVSLAQKPTDVVTVTIINPRTDEGTVSPLTLVFNPSNWHFPQQVRIKGVDEFIDDGDQTYTLVTLPAVSSDPDYSGFNPADVQVTNVDNDTAGVEVTPTAGLQTTEGGGEATFTVRLKSQPTSPVTIVVVSSDTSEGTIVSGNPVFDSLNWSTPKQIRVRGVEDYEYDGDRPWTALLGGASSSDPKYSGMDVPDVALVNKDNEQNKDTIGDVNAPTPNTTGTWSGPYTLRDPLGVRTGSFTLQISANPQFTTVVTGTISIGSESRSFVGTVKGTRMVLNVSNPNTQFFQLVGAVKGSLIEGIFSIQSLDGGYTSGEFRVNKV